MDGHRMGSAPNFTNACIVMFGVNITWVLILVWAIWGFVAALLLGCAVNLLLDRVSVWKARRDAAAIRRGKAD